MGRQFTLVRPTAVLRGAGLHSGEAASVRLWPAPAGAGLAFRRTDIAGSLDIPARVDSVESTARCVVLARGKARVSTVEHVLAACALSGLDNAVIAVEGPELPVGDGSALPFLEMIEEAGLSEQEAVRPVIAVRERVESVKGEARITAEPATIPSLRFRFRGAAALDGREAVFGPAGLSPREVASARTFCFEDELEALRAAGLGRGGNAGNVLVLRRDGSAVNEARGADEPLRHKLLDLAGDMALAGASIGAAVTAEGTGHALHVELLRRLMDKTEKKEGKAPNA